MKTNKTISPKRLHRSILNTLDLMLSNQLLLLNNQAVFHESNEGALITWPNHVKGRHNRPQQFTRIEQYSTIIRTSALNCILLDGAIIRACYFFNAQGLRKSSLLWWPSPFWIEPEDLELGGVLEIIELYSSSADWHHDLHMRSPVRFDYDVDNASDIHPASHLHFQSSECRLHVDRPICFNRFIKFIFENFYPGEFSSQSFWDDLECMFLSGEEAHSLAVGQSYLGWNEDNYSF